MHLLLVGKLYQLSVLSSVHKCIIQYCMYEYVRYMQCCESEIISFGSGSGFGVHFGSGYESMFLKEPRLY
jgi:hypothetical protein